MTKRELKKYCEALQHELARKSEIIDAMLDAERQCLETMDAAINKANGGHEA